MRGITFRGDRKIEIVTLPDPTPGPGEVVIEIKASGICGSDLHYYRGSTETAKRVIRGHEPSGIVVDVGPGLVHPLARAGTRVMVHHYGGCTGCEDCHAGWPQMCRQQPVTVFGTDADGSHASFMRVPAATLIPLDERLSFAAGAAISCGMGTAWGAFERMGLNGGDTVAIFGQGPVGLSATLLAKARGARVIALDLDDGRLKRAAGAGADVVINARQEGIADEIRERTGGGATKALETSGSRKAGQDALQSVRPWGTIGLVGIGSDLSLTLASILRRQLTIVPSWTMSLQGQKACADFVLERAVDVDSIFTDRWTLDDADEAYRVFDRQSGGKGVFLL